MLLLGPEINIKIAWLETVLKKMSQNICGLFSLTLFLNSFHFTFQNICFTITFLHCFALIS
jgi:hypothetical protein